MAFGRQADPGDKDLDDLRAAVLRLSRVPIVASAGNDGSDRTVYPAALAAEDGSPVVSVGALAAPTERAPYSNYGPWVREWRNGTNVISISSLTTADLDSELGTELTGRLLHPRDHRQRVRVVEWHLVRGGALRRGTGRQMSAG